jgi:iron complex transport system substrate-binding protein
VPLIPAGPDGTTAAPDNAAMTDLELWRDLPAVRAGACTPGTAIQLADRMDTVLTQLAGS